MNVLTQIKKLALDLKAVEFIPDKKAPIILELKNLITPLRSFDELDAVRDIFDEVKYCGHAYFYLMEVRDKLIDQIPSLADIA